MPSKHHNFTSQYLKNMYDGKIESFARTYVNAEFSGEPLTTETLIDVFEKAYRLGQRTQNLTHDDSLSIGELFPISGTVLFSPNDTIIRVWVTVHIPISYYDSNTIKTNATQEIEHFYFFNNEDKTILTNKEIYHITSDEQALPDGEYSFEDYIIMRSLRDEKFLKSKDATE